MKAIWGVLAFALLPVFLYGQTVNSWTNSSSGNWDETNSWSLGILPNNLQAVEIANSGATTIVIDATTVQDYPESLTVSNFALSAPDTLLLTNAGTNVPLVILDGTDQGGPEATIISGNLINLNSSVIARSNMVWFEGAQVSQDGGYISFAGTIIEDGAVYGLTNGIFEAGGLFSPGGATINQYGGTAFLGGLDLDYGSYFLYGGNLVAGPLKLGADAELGGGEFVQDGGTNQNSGIAMGTFGPGSTYQLNNGVIYSSGGLSLYATVDQPTEFLQYGGSNYLTDGISISGSAGHDGVGATYQLNGGFLSAQSLELDAINGYSTFWQTAGTALFAESVEYTGPVGAPSSLSIGTGTLACANVINLNGGCLGISESGGACFVTNLFQLTGYCSGGMGPDYVIPQGFSQFSFAAGTLSASNIEMGGIFTIGGTAISGRISNPGYFLLSGMINIGNANEHLGSFILSYPTNYYYNNEGGGETTNLALAHAMINFTGNSTVLAFANSSAETWTNSALLLVTNWSGLPSGGGNDQLYFGDDSTGLTASQLSQIQFINPSGLPLGAIPRPFSTPAKLFPMPRNGWSPASKAITWCSLGHLAKHFSPPPTWPALTRVFPEQSLRTPTSSPISLNSFSG